MMKGPPDPGTPAWSELLMHIVIAARIEPELWSESDALESDGWLARKYLSTLTPAWAEEVYGQEAIDAEFERIVSERAEYVAKLKQLFEIDVSTDQCHLCGLGGRPLADYDFGLAKPTQRKGDWTTTLASIAISTVTLPTVGVGYLSFATNNVNLLHLTLLVCDACESERRTIFRSVHLSPNDYAKHPWLTPAKEIGFHEFIGQSDLSRYRRSQ